MPKQKRSSARMVVKEGNMSIDLDSREIPFDRIPAGDDDLRAMLTAGPDVVTSEARPPIPPMPEVKVESSKPVQASSDSPDPSVLAELGLPGEREKALLKQKFGELRVVPIPFAGPEGRPQAYILRKLTRGNWRAMRDAAAKIVENKPGRDPDEVFQEKIVEMAVVWPALGPHWSEESPPGLIPTLFGVVQSMGLFFDPAAVMQMTFLL